MNRRQEIALRVVGVLAALLCLREGTQQEDWFLQFLVPLLILGGLVIFGLRDKGKMDRLPPKSLGILLLVLGTILAWGHVSARFDDVEGSVEDLTRSTDSLSLELHNR
jgi:hypothetical protein